MSKISDRELMRQKINVSDALLQSYKNTYLHDIRHLIHASYMTPEDLGTTFEHQGRHFEILGMTISGTLMLRETREEGIFYWECTRQFVQLKLGRFNKEFFKIKGKLMTREIPYPETKLFLAPLNARLKKEEEIQEDELDFDEDSSGEFVSYEEDNYDNEIEE